MYLQVRLQFSGCSASRLYHRYPKPYIELKLLKYFIVVLRKQIPEFPAQLKLEGPGCCAKVTNQCDFWNFFFSEVTIPKAKKFVRAFVNSTVFKCYRTFVKLQEKHEIIISYQHRIIEFTDTFLLTRIHFSGKFD